MSYEKKYRIRQDRDNRMIPYVFLSHCSITSEYGSKELLDSNQFMQREGEKQNKQSFNPLPQTYRRYFSQKYHSIDFLYLMGQNMSYADCQIQESLGNAIFTRDHCCHKKDWGPLDRSKKQLRGSSVILFLSTVGGIEKGERKGLGVTTVSKEHLYIIIFKHYEVTWVFLGIIFFFVCFSKKKKNLSFPSK